MKFLQVLIQGSRTEDTFTKINFYTSVKKVKAIMKLNNDFLATTPKAQSIKELTKWTSPKFKTFVLQKTLLRKWKDGQQTEIKYLQTYLQ